MTVGIGRGRIGPNFFVNLIYMKKDGGSRDVLKCASGEVMDTGLKSVGLDAEDDAGEFAKFEIALVFVESAMNALVSEIQKRLPEMRKNPSIQLEIGAAVQGFCVHVSREIKDLGEVYYEVILGTIHAKLSSADLGEFNGLSWVEFISAIVDDLRAESSGGGLWTELGKATKKLFRKS